MFEPLTVATTTTTTIATTTKTIRDEKRSRIVEAGHKREQNILKEDFKKRQEEMRKAQEDM